MAEPFFQPDLNRIRSTAPWFQNPLFEAVKKYVKAHGTETYIIGGWVRDKILGRNCKDIDFVVKGSGEHAARGIAELLEDARPVTVFKAFGTAHFRYRDMDVEFVGARKESYRSDSRKPIVEDGSLNDDQLRRDFTINALAISMNPANYGALVDPFDGIKDLHEGILRTPLNPEQTFSDDPLRMMRAIRFAGQLGFEIEAKTRKAILSSAERLQIISMERIHDEFNKMMMCPLPSLPLKLLFDCRLLHQFFPALVKLHGVDHVDGKSHKDNFYHTLEVLDNISFKTDKLWLRWAALLHDIAKPVTKKFEPGTGWTFHGHEDKGARMVPRIFRDLKLPMSDNMKYVQKLVQLHLRPIVLSKEEVTDSAVRRLLFDAGDDIDDLMLLCESDITTKNPKKMERYLRNFELVKVKLKEVEEKDHLRNWQPPLSGEDIMKAFGIKPSKEVGLIKTAIREAILEGELANSHAEAYQFMLAKGKELGLAPVPN
jgi:poly(A) polymerase